ncbi:unnamed protein product [Acanthosepion pharaonis]|uniref:Uncharacterized protein n=1 Tax=Acanthosepion pharaonis TaxID=158019 RepID=A0A812EWG8_ACAPH|nr:unnamed protein product [Sepia pharaonis]
MKGRFNYNSTLSEPFTIDNGIKQADILASTLFIIYSALTLVEAFQNRKNNYVHLFFILLFTFSFTFIHFSLLLSSFIFFLSLKLFIFHHFLRFSIFLTLTLPTFISSISHFLYHFFSFSLFFLSLSLSLSHICQSLISSMFFLFSFISLTIISFTKLIFLAYLFFVPL